MISGDELLSVPVPIAAFGRAGAAVAELFHRVNPAAAGAVPEAAVVEGH